MENIVCPSCNNKKENFASIKKFYINPNDREYICGDCKTRFSKRESKKHITQQRLSARG